MVGKGVATEGLDPDQTEKSLTRIENGIDKLLKELPAQIEVRTAARGRRSKELSVLYYLDPNHHRDRTRS